MRSSKMSIVIGVIVILPWLIFILFANANLRGTAKFFIISIGLMGIVITMGLTLALSLYLNKNASKTVSHSDRDRNKVAGWVENQLGENQSGHTKVIDSSYSPKGLATENRKSNTHIYIVYYIQEPIYKIEGVYLFENLDKMNEFDKHVPKKFHTTYQNLRDADNLELIRLSELSKRYM